MGIKNLLKFLSNYEGILKEINDDNFNKQKVAIDISIILYKVIIAIRNTGADLTNKKDCLKVCKNMDFIFMCAANSSGANVIEKKPLTHLTPNIIMNTLMLESPYYNGVKKFCFISSNTVYPVLKRPVVENDVNYKFNIKNKIETITNNFLLQTSSTQHPF